MDGSLIHKLLLDEIELTGRVRLMGSSEGENLTAWKRERAELSELETGESTGPIPIKGFSRRDVELVHQKFILGLKDRELAEHFGLSEGSCRVIVHRLRRRLLTLLTKR